MEWKVPFDLRIACVILSGPIVCCDAIVFDAHQRHADWWWQEELGWYYSPETTAPAWIYHADHGWLYLSGDWEAAAYLYALERGWLFTVGNLYPWAWEYDASDWTNVMLTRIDPSLYFPIDDASIVADREFRSFRLFPSEIYHEGAEETVVEGGPAV